MFTRILNSLLDGGKTGVDVGLSIIPGVLIISTLVMILTFGPGAEGYTGAAYEGVGFLPWAAGQINFIFDWLFGFGDPHLVAFPITALGAVGAALGLVPGFVEQGWADGNAIAVFTAIGMCWSGYLSTHTAMLDALGYRKLTSKAILAHTVGGLVAGISAHWMFVLFVAIFGSPEANKGFADVDPVEIKIEYVDENKVCTTVWVGEEFKAGRIFEDGAEDRATDTRSMAWYINDMLEEYVVVEGLDNGANYARFSDITLIYDKDMPEDMLESLKKEVSTGLDYYRDGISRSLWNRGAAYLGDKQKSKLDELVKIESVDNDVDVANTSKLEGIEEPLQRVADEKEAVKKEAVKEEDAKEDDADSLIDNGLADRSEESVDGNEDHVEETPAQVTTK